MFLEMSAKTMALQMSDAEAVQIIIDYLKGADDKVVDVALQMCLIDISSFGIDDWVAWSDLEIIQIFRNTADDTLSDIMNDVEGVAAGEDIIDELLGSEQSERIDYKRALSGMKSGSVGLFNALIKYIEIHDEVTGIYYLVE
jgi:hypothetical protein|tara:strand:+ start:515 stop:940 length:426 start_codon:yes stop_codon:yes gene_type:complete